MARVSELRLSTIWTESFERLVPPGAPMGFLGSQDDYARQCRDAESGGTQVTMPWASASGRRFWQYYLGAGKLDSIRYDQAWSLLVPLYSPLGITVRPLPEPLARVSVEGLCFPHGVTVVVTVVAKRDLDLDEMTDIIVRAHSSEEYGITWPDGSSVRSDVRGLVTDALERLRAGVIRDDFGRPPLCEPFTVATAIDGQVEDVQVDNPSNGQVHRALEAWCRLDPLWRDRRPHALDDQTSFRFKEKEQSPAGHILYGLKRSRAVWFPAYFTREGRPAVRKLGGYHRNLTLVSLQTDILLTMMQIAYAYVERRQLLPPVMAKLARGAAGALGRLYGAKLPTYQSWSAYRQIADSGADKMVEKVRDYLGMKPAALFRPPE